MSRRVVDCFTFCHELDLLELRLRTLEDVVDWFVLSESTITHTGNPKPLYYQQNKKRFGRWESRIRHVIVETMPSSSSWSRENHQRRCLMRGLPNLQSSDVVILSDLDEIPRPEVISRYDSAFGIKGVSCYHSLLYLNTQLIGRKWTGPKLFPFSLLHKADMQEIRAFDSERWGHVIPDGGWHFSYCGGLDSFMFKVNSFAHRDDTPRHDPAAVTSILKDPTRKRLSAPGPNLILRKIDRSFPLYVQTHVTELSSKGLIWSAQRLGSI